MPSSLLMRMRAFAHSIGNLNTGFDRLAPAEIGPEGLRDLDAAIVALIVLHDRDQGAADRQAGTVEGMHEPGLLLARRAEARLHAPGLEVAAIGAARDLAVAVLAGQPNLDVVC